MVVAIISITMQLRNTVTRERGTSLAEVLLTVMVVSVFFASIFQLNTTCFRFIFASKENISSLECVQDRIEQLRNMEFSKLVDPAYLTTNPPTVASPPGPPQPLYRNLTTPANESVLARNATEEVTISAYGSSGATTPRLKITRAPGASHGAVNERSDVNMPADFVWDASGASNFNGISLVQVDVKYTWKAVMGGRQRSETSSTIVAAGTKK